MLARYMDELIRQKDKEFFDFCANTSERVMPAAVKGSDVEQQAKEVGTQVQQEDVRESKDR